jgi:Mg2+ and Co2+ transporter CorA
MNNSDNVSSPVKNNASGVSGTKENLRKLVNLILPDSLMLFLAIVMVPVVLLPLFLNLSGSVLVLFRFIDYTIIGIFIIEYLAKLILAHHIFRHFINPWHLLDLFIVIVPFATLMPVFNSQLRVSPLLRLLRIVRVVAVGGRTIDRRRQMAVTSRVEPPVQPPMSIQVVDGTLANTYENVSIQALKSYLNNSSHTWGHFSNVSPGDLDSISEILNIPKMILESGMIEESYPRVDYFEEFSMIFARVADVPAVNLGQSQFSITRSGLLVICYEQNIISLSKTKTDLFDRIVEEARNVHKSGDPVVVTILYTVLKHIMDKDRQIITAIEQQLIRLESIPPRQRPSNFLETTFNLRKEANQIVPSLLHLKEILSVITSKRVPLEGFGENHARVFDILSDEAEYLHETASNARDNLQSLVDLHINTNSFETNKVMRVIAVITCLGIIPAVMGLLGSNIMGNPWEIQLWQVFSIVGILMVAMGWIFWRLGWLKG